MKQIQLGNKVRCTVSGFTGIAISRVEYMNGCVQFGIKPKVGKDGKLEESIYIDCEQLEVVGPGVKIAPKQSGGPSTDAPKHGYRG